MRRAIQLAAEARHRGDEPFGALLVSSGAVVETARNAVNTTADVTQHAELRLISKASRRMGSDALCDATLYTSTEPCAMCAGAAYWAGIDRIVFGFPAHALEELAGGGGLHMPSRTVLGDASRTIAIDGPVLPDEARAVHEGFWSGSGSEAGNP